MYEIDDNMSSLDRLIELAKKTGNTLIIHDSVKDHSFVLLDADTYADLLETKNDWKVLEKHIKSKELKTTSKCHKVKKEKKNICKNIILSIIKSI